MASISIVKQAVVIVVGNKEQVLLGFQKRGLGKGRWNCFSGKVECNESLAEAAKRELKEESGLEAKKVERMGFLALRFIGDLQMWHIHVFKTNHVKGTPIETEEMKPEWFVPKEIPYKQMWPDDKYWLPLCLHEKKFSGHFVYLDVNTLTQFVMKENLKII